MTFQIEWFGNVFLQTRGVIQKQQFDLDVWSKKLHLVSQPYLTSTKEGV